MPLVRLVPNAAMARLDSLTEVGYAVFDDTLVPSVLATDVDSLAGEIDDGVATGYARITDGAVAWNPTTLRLEVDGAWPTFDLADAPAVAYLVAFDPIDDQVVSFLPLVDAPMPGYDGFAFELSDGVAGRGNEWPLQVAVADLDQRVTDLETNGGGGGLPDPSGEDDGDVLTVSSGVAVWAPPPGGGAPDTAGADPGDVYTVDTPGQPAVWAPPAAGSSWTMEQAGDIGIYTDGTLAIFADYAAAAGPIDTPTLVGTTPAGTRPGDPQTRRISWHGGGMDFGDAMVVVDDDSGTATSTPGGVMVVDLTGTLTNTDDVTPLLLGLTWTVGN